MTYKSRKNLAINLNLKMRDLNMNQKELSEKINITQAFLSNILKTKKAPCLDKLDEIAQFLETTASALISEPENKKYKYVLFKKRRQSQAHSTASI